MRITHKHHRCVWFLVLLLAITSLGHSTYAQSDPPPAQPAETQPAATTAPGGAGGRTIIIPLSEIITQSDAAMAKLRAFDADITNDPVTLGVEQELPIFIKDIDARFQDTTNALASQPSLETFRHLEADWQPLTDTLAQRKKSLSHRAAQLEENLKTVNQLLTPWAAAQAQQTETPPELMEKIKTTAAALEQVRGRIDQRRTQVLKLQSYIAELDTHVSESLETVHKGRSAIVDRIFDSDSPPIWSSKAARVASQNLVEGSTSQHAILNQYHAVKAYFERKHANVITHVVILSLIIIGLFWARSRFQQWVKADPTLAPAAPVFISPISAAIVLSLVLSIWIYPQAPRMFWSVSGAIAMIPALFMLHRLTDRKMIPILYVLVSFYFIDQFRTIIASVVFWPRFLFLAEMLAACLFLIWIIRRNRKDSQKQKTLSLKLWAMQMAYRLAAVFFAIAFISNACGYVNFSTLVGNAVLHSAYLAFMIYACTKVIDALIIMLMHVRLVAQLGAIKRQAALIRRRINTFIGWVGVIIWALFTLDMLTIRESTAAVLKKILTASLNIGSLDLSLGNVLAFVLVIWLSFALSRFIRFILQEEIYPRVKLSRGIPSAISSVLHYLILFIGFIIAMSAMGTDMTKFTILAGAFGVGLGFGLQNIINNFFSGLIVLFARPIKVGDVIDMDGIVGTVTRIGIRATIFRTPAGAEILMPNSRLISERVINWTLSDRFRGIELAVTVAKTSEPQKVLEVFSQVAGTHPGIIQKPAPRIQFVRFGPAGSQYYELCVWTDKLEQWTQIRSDFGIALYEAFAREGIAVM